MINMRKKYGIFNTNNFNYALNGGAKRINLNSTDTNVTVVGNFRVTQGAVYPNFQHTGTWYDYFTGDSVVVSNATAPITFAPGEWHIYSDVKLEKAAFMELEELREPLKPFVLYPNPSGGELDFLVDFAEGVEVRWELTDLNGKTLQKAHFVSERLEAKKLDFTKLPAGVYMLNIQAGSEWFVEKIILQ